MQNINKSKESLHEHEGRSNGATAGERCLAAHGGSHVSKSDISQASEGDLAKIIQIVAHTSQDDTGTHQSIKEDDQTSWHVAREIAENKTNEH
jgi:hypothetical protein